MSGRGRLYYFGPNYAADPIVTRFNPEVAFDSNALKRFIFQSGKLEMVAIQRRDTGIWAIPGGGADTVPFTANRD